MMHKSVLFLYLLVVFSCTSPVGENKSISAIGFLDVTEDATLAKARTGFFDALDAHGFSKEKGTLLVFMANAQGDIPALGQSCDYLLSKKITLLATNATLATVTAVQRTQEMPVCMMISPRPDLAGITNKEGKAPANLFGVYETLDYLDTAVAIIKPFFPATQRIGTIYNPGEPQSRDAFARLVEAAKREDMEVISLPVNNSSETQLVTQSLLLKKPDVFFALPDNVIFSSFETVVENCNEARVPVFTSESGLVSRGALASYGADFYHWGYQAGEQAAQFLKTQTLDNLPPEIVRMRVKTYNKKAAALYHIHPDSSFRPSE